MLKGSKQRVRLRQLQSRGYLWSLFLLIVLGACSGPEEQASSVSPAETAGTDTAASAAQDQTAGGGRFGGNSLTMPADLMTVNAAANAQRNAYFGDLHVHTVYSFDAFAFGTLATPSDAYRYAQGESIAHPAGYQVQLRAPLDFYAVTDHAMFLGAVKAAADPTTEFSQLPHVKGLHNLNAPDNMHFGTLPQRVSAFSNFLPETLSGVASGKIDPELLNSISRSAWSDIVRAAEQHNQPGTFTTFVAYEYTSSTDDRGNLHRNVIFRDADQLPAMPFSRFHSQDPAGLWDWMDGLRDQGIESLAIPHNSNGSNGQMFKLVDWAGDPLDDDYGEQRLRNEPLVEITQVKGTSETHPLLSVNDEWAEFEIMPYRVATTLPSAPDGSYVRDALLKGLSLEEQGVANPYRFGFVGASDTHTGAASLDESNYFSKVGLLDSDGERRGSVPLSAATRAVVEQTGRAAILDVDGQSYVSGAYDTWGASGLTGVWAEENSRDAIYRAFRRKETFATSGPRLRVRLFAGYDFDDSVIEGETALQQAYAQGVSMGSDLLARAGRNPHFVAWAAQDPNSGSLQRLQIVKGWIEAGTHQERVFDVACAGGQAVDPERQRCPDNGAKVDLSDCSAIADSGAAQLRAFWQDPEFDADQRAFYYLRALENPSCRWSTWDAVRAGVAPRSDLQATIQERAWSSPIWYVP